MATDAHPSFEVATIKPADPNAVNGNFRIGGHRVSITNQTVGSLIAVAYSVHQAQIVDGPAWLFSERFDVEGEPDIPGAPSLKQVQEMLQGLLADRFGLKFHHDQREVPVYAIVPAKGGPKLAASARRGSNLPSQTGRPSPSGRSVRFRNSSMADFALGMQPYMDKPVVDRTGLAGRFDFDLTWTPDTLAANAADAPPGVFTAVEEQLGLKLKPERAAVDVIVIDHVERPAEN